ncbi:MAG: aldehyde dehydrogenase family protein [Candidatus Methanoperedens sp.]|nr:aldehyde dehydrogenase family protein [Candidatus Methanoperedens sp.]
MLEGKLLIGGKWIPCERKFESSNPATGEVLGRVCLAGKKEVTEAVVAARLAQVSWKNTGISERAGIFIRIGDEILKRKQELKTLITMEMGRPLFESEIEVLKTSEMVKYFANEGKTYLEGDAIPISPDTFSFTRFEPVGVVGVIKPWNYPMLLPLWAIAPALIAGNTVVLKPSDLTPFVGIEIGKICQDAGIPDGVINVVTGDGNTGKSLVSSDIDMVSFTGSAETGKNIMKNSAEKLHRISLELGGSDAFIVFKDADIEEAINGAVWGRFMNCGQVCVSPKRIFVESDIADSFIEEFVNKTRNLIIGKGLDPGTDIGPMVSMEQREKLELQVEDAVRKGAIIECGGKIPLSLQEGYYYEPTVLTGVTPEMKVMKEEVFGPVAAISVFENMDEAIALANKTIYGLGASVWTKNLDTAMYMSSQLECGMVWVNEICTLHPQCPWGGIKHSGMGKDLSRYGIREFVSTKHVNINLGTGKTRQWWFPYAKTVL